MPLAPNTPSRAAALLPQGSTPGSNSTELGDTQKRQSATEEHLLSPPTSKRNKLTHTDEDAANKPGGSSDAIAGNRSGGHSTNNTAVIRAGIQPAPYATPNPLATKDFAETAMRIKVEAAVVSTERHYSASADINVKRLEESTRDGLIKSLDHLDMQNHPFRYRRCDYIGLILSWNPGPLSLSIESYYRFSVYGSSVHYHAPSNVGVISNMLNFARRTHGPLALPLASEFMRVSQEQNLPFELRKRKWAWLHNAQCNAAALSVHVSSLGSAVNHHDIRAAHYGSMTEEERKDILESARTGIPHSEEPSVKSLFPILGSEQIRQRLCSETDTEIYTTCLHIAQSHGISQPDFEYYCTIQAPAEDMEGPRVFFPFHVLSHAQAEAVRWSWTSTLNFAASRLTRMSSQCNRNFQDLHGEKDLKTVRLLYWMAHHVCRELQRIQHRFAHADQEEIRFYLLLDPWGLPIVPYRNHIFAFSLCRRDDHGIAMKTGITIPEGEAFNPVDHFDYSQCTITINTQLTNMAMKNHAPEWWDCFRIILTYIPIHHWLWQPADTLGERIWLTNQYPNITPQPPVPSFSPPLIPISNWIEHNERVPAQLCHICPDKTIAYNSLGALIHHYRVAHLGHGPLPENDPRGILQPLENSISCPMDGWDQGAQGAQGAWPCPKCGKELQSQRTLEGHISTVHSENRPKIPCPKCGKELLSQYTLEEHLGTVHSENKPKFPCPKCGKELQSKRTLKENLNVHLENRPIFPCPKCGKVFRSQRSLEGHLTNPIAINNCQLSIAWRKSPEPFI